MDLYNDKDSVVIINDSDLIGTKSKISKNKFVSHGILKAYAPWCGHCQSKVKCINKLAKIMKEFNVTVYVINVDNNPMFAEYFKHLVRGYPTFINVDSQGAITDVMKTSTGSQVSTVPEIIASLCGNDANVCKYVSSFNDC